MINSRLIINNRIRNNKYFFFTNFKCKLLQLGMAFFLNDAKHKIHESTIK